MSARRFFMRWYNWAARCRLRPAVKVARMLRRHLPDLPTYVLHPITNATTEGYNSVIQAPKDAARGFRSFGNYRTRIRLFCGKRELGLSELPDGLLRRERLPSWHLLPSVGLHHQRFSILKWRR